MSSGVSQARDIKRVVLSARGITKVYHLIPSLTARENVALVTDIAENPMRPEEALEADRVVTLLDGRVASERRNAQKRAPGELEW